MPGQMVTIGVQAFFAFNLEEREYKYPVLSTS